MQIPKGVAMALQSLLGVDGNVFAEKFDEAFNNLRKTLLHFDNRLIDIEKSLSELKKEIENGRG